MRHRVFIAINLPAEIKRELANFQSKWPELPVRWVRLENLHITLAFLGYLSDEELVEVLKITKEAAQRNSAFQINLVKICYGPPKKMPPRMIWVEGEKSKELGKLQGDLENSLAGRITYKEDYNPPTALPPKGRAPSRPYTPHITLGRIRQWEFRQIEPEERPEVNEEISLSFGIKSIEVMESQLKKGGAEYTILESAQLGRF